MPVYTRGSRNRVISTRGKGRDGIFRPNQRRRPGFFADDLQEEAFAGEQRRGVDKLIHGSTDDRGRIRSEYFTDEHGRLKVPYGSMYEYVDYGAADSSITLTTQDTFYGWVNATDDVTYGAPYIDFEGNATADRLVIGQEGAGIWMVAISYALHSGGAAFVTEASVFKNGSQLDQLTSYRYFSGSNDLGAGSISGLVAAEAGDYFDLRFTSKTANNKEIDVHNINFSMWRINHKR